MELFGAILEFFFDLATLKFSRGSWITRLLSGYVFLVIFALIGYFLLWGIVKVYSVSTNPYSKKLKEIEVALSSYKQFHSKYPASLKDVIDFDPNRRNWQIDHWGTGVQYKASEDLQSYTFTSAGEDMIFNTEDDIRISK